MVCLWIQVYPLLAAMTFVTSLCTFQLVRNVLQNPDVRYNINFNLQEFDISPSEFFTIEKKKKKKLLCRIIHFLMALLICRVNKAHRKMAVLENREEGMKYAEHGFRKFLRTRPPEVMPTINHFFSQDNWTYIH